MTSVPTAAMTAVGIVAGVVLALLLRRGNYRRPDEATRLRLHASWACVPVLGAVFACLTRHPGPLTAAAACFAVGGVWLAWVDLDVHRLPTGAVLATGVATLLALVGAAAAASSWTLLGGAVLGAAILGGFYRLLSLAGMGDGDVHLALVAGLVLGAHGLDALARGTLLTFALAAVIAAAALVRGRARHSHMAFGPAIIAGSLLAIC